MGKRLWYPGGENARKMMLCGAEQPSLRASLVAKGRTGPAVLRQRTTNPVERR